MPSKPAKRRNARSEPAAIAMLIADHRMVEKLFKRFEKADEEEKSEIIEQACNALKVHTQIEEELFYPAAAQAIDDEDLLEEARIEHKVAKRLIEDIERGESRDASFKVLSESVMHHVEEEESELFPKVRKARFDMDDLAEQMQRRKQELESEMGMEEEATSSRRAPRRPTSKSGPRSSSRTATAPRRETRSTAARTRRAA